MTEHRQLPEMDAPPRARPAVTLLLKLSFKLRSKAGTAGAAGRSRLALAAWSLAAFSLATLPSAANSALLESVKQNPQLARTLCGELKGFNSQGLSYTSTQVVNAVAARQNLSSTDAEILATYVVGLYCPDVR